MHISEFKKGDIITRTERSLRGDGSYVGEKMIYAGIANGCIYGVLRHPLFGIMKLDVPVDEWSDGWGFWVDPDLLFDNIDLSFSTKKELQEKLEYAISIEDYEQADFIKSLLNKNS